MKMPRVTWTLDLEEPFPLRYSAMVLTFIYTALKYMLQVYRYKFHINHYRVFMSDCALLA